jgi:hypothetical protein
MLILRELKNAIEMDQGWAFLMQELLLDFNLIVNFQAGVFPLTLEEVGREKQKKNHRNLDPGYRRSRNTRAPWKKD